MAAVLSAVGYTAASSANKAMLNNPVSAAKGVSHPAKNPVVTLPASQRMSPEAVAANTTPKNKGVTRLGKDDVEGQGNGHLKPSGEQVRHGVGTRRRNTARAKIV
jgi:hypothetical protein